MLFPLLWNIGEILFLFFLLKSVNKNTPFILDAFHKYSKEFFVFDNNDQFAETTKKIELISEDKPVLKYEDKFLEDFRKHQIIDLVPPKKTNFVMEHTPLGNVVMWYDADKESFRFNSDNTIPYRFLEVVARKYVLTFQCPNLYVDMEQEIKSAAEKREEDEKNKIIASASASKSSDNPPSQKLKPNVFAKFKDYNKTTSKSSAGAPGKNANAPSSTNKEKDSKPVLLKENANRFTCDGRFCNFSFLVKIDKTVTNKRLAMSFADFKNKVT